MSFIKVILVGHVINQGRKIYSVWPKKMLRRCHVLADVIIFFYEVPCIFWNYINVEEVRWITLKKIITKCDGIITNCDSLVYYKVRWTVITNCDSFFITKGDTVYYKLRQVLTGITKCDDYYKLRQYYVGKNHATLDINP